MKNSGKTKYAILGILTMNSMSGYDIKRVIDNSVGHFWNESFGQLYPALKKMEDDELVVVYQDNNGAKQRNIYSITDKGRETLKEWLSLPVETEQIRLESLLKIFFGYNVNPEQTIKLIKEMKSDYEIKLSILRNIVISIEQYKNIGNTHIYPLLTARYGILNYEANLKWTEMALEELERIEVLNK